VNVVTLEFEESEGASTTQFNVHFLLLTMTRPNTLYPPSPLAGNGKLTIVLIGDSGPVEDVRFCTRSSRDMYQNTVKITRLLKLPLRRQPHTGSQDRLNGCQEGGTVADEPPILDALQGKCCGI